MVHELPPMYNNQRVDTSFREEPGGTFGLVTRSLTESPLPCFNSQHSGAFCHKHVLCHLNLVVVDYSENENHRALRPERAANATIFPLRAVCHRVTADQIPKR